MADLMPCHDRRPCPFKGATRAKVNIRSVSNNLRHAQDAIAELERKHGPCAAYEYHDAVSEPVGMIVR